MKSKINKCSALLEKFLNQKMHNFNNLQNNVLPTSHGVYRIFETGAANDSSLYIGISNNIRRRIYNNHLTGVSRNSTFRRKLITRGAFQSENEITTFLENKCSFQFIELETRTEALTLEHFSIAILEPSYND